MAQEMLPEQGELFHSLPKEVEDFLRDAVEELVREVMEEEVRSVVGAGFYERSPERSTHRNGYRKRRWDTRVGSTLLQIPKLREGSYFPSFLEPRRRAERALVSIVQEAYIQGVSTRNVDALVHALGGSRIDKSAVSRICEELDQEAEAFRTRPIDEEIVYVWLDALYEKVRSEGRVRSKAVVVAIGVTAKGTRTVLGFEVGDTESEAFWTEFLRSLVRRGLAGRAAGDLGRPRGPEGCSGEGVDGLELAAVSGAHDAGDPDARAEAAAGNDRVSDQDDLRAAESARSAGATRPGGRRRSGPTSARPRWLD